jgi:hypothetical protein
VLLGMNLAKQRLTKSVAAKICRFLEAIFIPSRHPVQTDRSRATTWGF